MPTHEAHSGIDIDRVGRSQVIKLEIQLRWSVLLSFFWEVWWVSRSRANSEKLSGRPVEKGTSEVLKLRDAFVWKQASQDELDGVKYIEQYPQLYQ